MKKQKKQMLILLIVCLVCVGGYFLLQKVDLEKEEETTASETVKLDIFDSESISELTVAGENELHFVKKDDVWYAAEDESLNLDQSTVQSLVRNLKTIYVDTVIEAPEDLDQFGLADPAMTVTAVMADGNTAVIYTGIYNDMTYCYYIQVEGDANVYLVDNYVIGSCKKSLDEFIVVEETETETEEEAEADSAE